MNTNRRILFLLTLFSLGGFTASSSAEVTMSHACTAQESWDQNSKWMDSFRDFTSGKTTAMFGFSEALNLKKLSQLMNHADFERDFSEYWVGRVLFDLKLDFVAQQAFHSVYENSNQLEVKKAALACIAEIEKRTPDIKVPSTIHSSLIVSDHDKVELADALFLSLLQNLSQNFSSKLAAQLPEAHQNLILGIYASQRKKFSEAIPYFQKFIASPSASGPFLKTYVDQARLFLARALYSVGKFPEAANEFQMVTKTANLEIDAMSDLSWAYLQSNRFDDVLGIAMQLRVGSLRNTFAPEASMVAAMALNERCLFPESVKMINSFNHDYAASYEWLSHHQDSMDIYSEIVKILKKTTADKTASASNIPNKISSEWLKSQDFLSRQMELNSLISQPSQLAKVQEQAYLDQIKLTDETITQLSKFVKDVKIAKLKLKPGEELSDSFGDRYLLLKKQLRKLARYTRASKTWRPLAKNYLNRIPQIRTKLVAKVNQDLSKRNGVLFTELDRIRENTDLIEVEIYNGASHDMIWKNAHPDFEQLVNSIKEEKEAPKPSQVWSWGRYLASELDDAEVWEDEMGALKADVSDQCQKKEKYLSLKVIKH